MAKKFLTSIDLTKNELQNARIHNLAVPPTSPGVGQPYFDTTLKAVGVWDGTSWDYSAAKTDLDVKVDKTTTVNGKSLGSNVALTTADVPSSYNKNYVTDAQLAVVAATTGTNTGDETAATIKTKLGVTVLSGSNTGDQTITFTGDLTGTGTGSIAATLAANAVTMSKMADLPANTIIGNNTGSAADPVALTVAQLKVMLGIAATKYAANIGNGTLTNISVAHGLATLDVGVWVYEVATNTQVFPDVTLTDTNNVVIGFAVAPTSNQFRVVVFG